MIITAPRLRDVLNNSSSGTIWEQFQKQKELSN